MKRCKEGNAPSMLFFINGEWNTPKIAVALAVPACCAGPDTGAIRRRIWNFLQILPSGGSREKEGLTPFYAGPFGKSPRTGNMAAAFAGRIGVRGSRWQPNPQFKGQEITLHDETQLKVDVFGLEMSLLGSGFVSCPPQVYLQT